jgi:hypothetical protein
METFRHENQATPITDSVFPDTILRQKNSVDGRA